jgi:hypothetical protein
VSVLFAFPFIGALSASTEKIQIVTIFEYPSLAGVSTLPQKINDGGDIAGQINAAGRVLGFVLFHNGHFTPPIIEPNDTGNSYTDLRGINNSRLLCGFYINSVDGAFHGFFLATDTGFTEFNVADALETQLYSLNDAGNVCGAFSADDVIFQAFVSISGTVVPISIPDATTSFAFGINNSNEVVGAYIDSSFVEHGFFRDAAGTVTAPVDPPGATFTILFGLNDEDIIVGRFADSSGAQRGFVLELPATVFVFDKPGATLTSLNGINNNNLMCGRYVDSSGVAHGVKARVIRTPAD